MSTFDERCTAIADVAAEWRDPDHPSRASAVEKTLDAPNRWTEEALTYALNRWMHQFTSEGLDNWLSSRETSSQHSVGVLHGASSPFDGIRAAIAVWAQGYSYVGHVPESSPAILPAFADDLTERLSDISIEFVPEGVLFDRVDALLAQPEPGEIEPLQDQCEAHDIPADRRLLRPVRYSVGILDGHESEDERESLAEDMLLYEGEGSRRLAVLWAPRELSPDPYLEAMANFRGVFPVHPDTPGTLQMQQAFLEARDESHAYAEGLEFLVSRATPEPQKSAHIRWSEYDTRSDVEEWIHEHQEELYAVIARPSLHEELPDDMLVCSPGGVHTPPLDDHDGHTIADFLNGLS